jgi:nucleoid-associated protein YgaU
MNTDIKDLIGKVKIDNPKSILAVLSLVAALALLIWTTLSTVSTWQTRLDLELRLDGAQQSLARLEQLQTTQPETLRDQIERNQSQLRMLLIGFPTARQAADEVARYYGYADEQGAQLMRLETLLVTPEEERQTAYRVQRFFLEVRGDVPSLLRFLARANGGPYKTFVLDNINIKQDQPAIANADLLVYSSTLVEEAASPVTSTTLLGALAPVQPQTTDVTAIERALQQAWQNGDWQRACEYGTRLLEEAPQRTDIAQTLSQIYLQWGRELLAQGDTQAASFQLTRALQLDPNNREALDALKVQPAPTAHPVLTSTPAPGVASATATPETLIHIVQRGDTLSSIAARYRTTVSEIMAANNLRTTTIVPGQRFIIPRRG